MPPCRRPSGSGGRRSWSATGRPSAQRPARTPRPRRPRSGCCCPASSRGRPGRTWTLRRGWQAFPTVATLALMISVASGGGRGQAADRPDPGRGGVTALARGGRHEGQTGGQQVGDGDPGGRIGPGVGQGHGERDGVADRRGRIVDGLGQRQVGAQGIGLHGRGRVVVLGLAVVARRRVGVDLVGALTPRRSWRAIRRSPLGPG